MPKMTIPAGGVKVCARCEKQRGNQRAGWEPITDGPAGPVVGFTCPECPTAAEPIRREVTAGGRVRWLAVVDVPGDGGKRRQAKGRFATVPEARAFVAQARGAARAGAVWRGGETLADLAARWLAGRRDVREVTLRGYRDNLAPVLRRLGSVKVTALSVADVEGLMAYLAAGTDRPGRDGAARPRGARAVRSSVGRLAQALDLAAREGTVPTNVARLARMPRQRQARGRDLRHWQPEEVERFRERADRHDLAALWRLTLCGLTRADVCGLRWSDVDLSRGLVTVAQGRVDVGGSASVVDDPKSAARRRTVPVDVMHPGTVARLRALADQQRADRERAGAAWQDTGNLVLVDSLGCPWRPERYSDEFRRLAASAGLPDITLHQVRHSLAFAMLARGVAPSDAAALLGHTLDVFLSHYAPQTGNAGAARAAAAFGSAPSARPGEAGEHRTSDGRTWHDVPLVGLGA